MSAPQPINPALGLPVTRYQPNRYRESRMERLGELVLDLVLAVVLPLLVVGCLWARFLP